MLVFGEVDWILQALVIGSSKFNEDRVKFTLINQPLYIPRTGGLSGDYGLTLRHPIGNREWWELKEDVVASQLELLVGVLNDHASAFFKQANTPADLAAYSERRYPNSANPPTIEVEVYGWALSNNREKYQYSLKRLFQSIEAMPPRITWGKPILDRALILNAAFTEGADAVNKLLSDWRESNFRYLKLK